MTQSLGGSDPQAQGEFWYQLAKRPIASNDDAFHALLLYVDGKDPNPDYTARVKTLKDRRMLPADFTGSANQAVDRGTLAVALDRELHIQGGLTMRLLGPSPRYALRAAEDQGIFPMSSPNQGVSGGEFVGIMQKAEEYQRGNPSDGPAALLPDEIHRVAMLSEDPVIAVETVAAMEIDTGVLPLYLDDVAPPPPATSPTTQPVHLKAIVTGTQGDLVEIRANPNAPWKRAHLGMPLFEGYEIRTGPKSAIRFLIPKDEAFCLDSEGSITLQQAVMDAKKAKTRIDLDRGRLREDLSHNTPVHIEEAGIEHDTVIKSPHSALALRGTKVSLFEQASFEPIAVSLSGQALFTNTDGLRVPFGGTTHVVIVGNQTSPADQADARSTFSGAGNQARLEFETRELAIVTQRGGFQKGDVLVGDLSVNDFKTLPGALDFVLQWTGGPQQSLNDLNLAVFSPLDPHNSGNSSAPRDYVANPPFTYSLNPNSPATKEIRATLYPETSRSGGQITTNSVGPDGLELAFWPKNYPTGNYGVVVYDLVDSLHPPAKTVDPVTYTLNVYENNTKIFTQISGTIGQLQTSPYYVYNVPAAPAGSALRTASVNTKTLSSNPLTITREKH